MTIIWTRSLEDWPQDQNLFKKRGITDYIHFPCISLTSLLCSDQIEKISKLKSEFPNYDRIFIFTSKNAVNFLLHDASLMQEVATCKYIFAIGKATAECLNKLTLRSQVINSQDLDGIIDGCSLAESIFTQKKKFALEKSLIFIPGAKKRAFDMDKYFTERNIKCISIDLYENSEAPPPDFPDKEKFYSLLPNIPSHDLDICFASPSACRGFMAGINQSLFQPIKQNSKVYCIGSTTYKEAAKHFKSCFVSAEQSIESLLIQGQSW